MAISGHSTRRSALKATAFASHTATAPTDSQAGPTGLAVMPNSPPETAEKPRRLTPAYKRQIRKLAETAIEQLISLLDDIDGDSDLEPYLSQSTGHSADQLRDWTWPAEEGDNNSDDEPWLSSPEPTVSQRAIPWRGKIEIMEFDPLDQSRWGTNTSDLETQCDDEGHDSDSEPDFIADNGYCGEAPFVPDQSNLQTWAYGQ